MDGNLNTGVPLTISQIVNCQRGQVLKGNKDRVGIDSRAMLVVGPHCPPGFFEREGRYDFGRRYGSIRDDIIIHNTIGGRTKQELITDGILTFPAGQKGTGRFIIGV